MSSMKLIRGTLDVLILKTLSWEPLHGYAISKTIRLSSSEEFQIEEGALYPALRRLQTKGLLESHWAETETGREAKYYELTDAGRDQLDREIRDWQRYVDAMAAVLYREQPLTA